MSKAGDDIHEHDLRQVEPNERISGYGETEEDPLLFSVTVPADADRNALAEPVGVMVRSGRGMAVGCGACGRGMVAFLSCLEASLVGLGGCMIACPSETAAVVQDCCSSSRLVPACDGHAEQPTERIL